MDFDSFLERASEEARLASENEERIAQATERTWEVIRQHQQLLRLVDSDEALQEELTHAAILNFMEGGYEDASKHPEDYPDGREERQEFIFDGSRDMVTNLQLTQSFVINQMEMLTALYQMHTAGELSEKDTERFIRRKKILVAQIMVQHQLEPEEEWIAIVNELIPIGDFNAEDPTDQQYLLDAMEELANRQENEEALEVVITEGLEQIGITDESPPELIAATTNMMIMGITDIRVVNATAQRESDLMEYGLANNVPVEIIRKLITFLESQFPLQTP